MVGPRLNSIDHLFMVANVGAGHHLMSNLVLICIDVLPFKCKNLFTAPYSNSYISYENINRNYCHITTKYSKMVKNFRGTFQSLNNCSTRVTNTINAIFILSFKTFHPPSYKYNNNLRILYLFFKSLYIL